MSTTALAIKDAPAPLPTPTPSPPSCTLALPLATCTRRLSLIEREKHISDARAAAEQARMLYLARAMRDAAQPATASTTSVRMVRYAFNVEQSEGGKKVLKQVTVIVPELPRDGREREIRRLRPASSVVFLAPHTRRAPGPAGSSAAPAPPPPRRLSLTTLSNVSLLPPPRPIQPFVSLAGAGAQVEQRRRAGVSLRAADAPLQAWAEAEGMERVSAWARDQRARLVRKRDGEDEDECDATWGAKRARGESLSERRGRRVQPLRFL